MQNLEWFKKFSLLFIIIIFFLFIYGYLNFTITSLEKKKKEIEKELVLLKEEYTELLIKYENLSNPKLLIKKAIDFLKLKFGNVEVIEIDSGNDQ